jgi:hypothetical protein
MRPGSTLESGMFNHFNQTEVPDLDRLHAVLQAQLGPLEDLL